MPVLLDMVHDHQTEGESVKDIEVLIELEPVISWELNGGNEGVLHEPAIAVAFIEA